MRRVLGTTRTVFWASGALTAVVAVLAWVIPGLQEERLFLALGGAASGVGVVTSAFLFWHQRREDRREQRAIRRESRDVPVDQDGEWSPRTWLYVIAFGIFFALSWFLLPHLFLS